MTKNNLSVEVIDPAVPHSSVVSRAAAVLTEGNLVVAPTETRYGLLARADRLSVLKKLYEVKKRSHKLPSAIFVKSMEDISRYAELNKVARKIASKLLPGPLTLVLKAKGNNDWEFVVKGKVGIRYSSAPFINLLLNKIDFPITATSANISQEKECTTIEEIALLFNEKVALYIDGGELSNPVSTVVDLSGDKVEILREGAIATEIIERILAQN
ncbi:MAG: threonylcarbamoyl-AMP synthase [FCB group bacterium]|nr:threonylcarbamoyl-AMP synthase [FCB group bacterium]